MSVKCISNIAVFLADKLEYHSAQHGTLREKIIDCHKTITIAFH